MARSGDLSRVDPKPVIGIAAVLASTLFVPLMGVFVRWLSQIGTGLPEILAWRSYLVLAILLVPLLLGSQRAALRRAHVPAHLIHAFFGLSAMALIYWSLGYLPLATVIAIQFTAPIFTRLLAMLFLGERPDAKSWLWLAIGLAGALIIIRPGFEGFHWASLLVLAGSAMGAGMLVAVRAMPRISSNFAVLFYYSLIGSLAFGAAQLWLNGPAALSIIAEPGHPLPFAGLVVVGLVLHISLAMGYRLSRSTLVSGLDYLRLLWAALLGWLIFAELPDRIDLAGMVIVVAAGMAVVRQEAAQKT